MLVSHASHLTPPHHPSITPSSSLLLSTKLSKCDEPSRPSSLTRTNPRVSEDHSHPPSTSPPPNEAPAHGHREPCPHRRRHRRSRASPRRTPPNAGRRTWHRCCGRPAGNGPWRRAGKAWSGVFASRPSRRLGFVLSLLRPRCGWSPFPLWSRETRRGRGFFHVEGMPMLMVICWAR